MEKKEREDGSLYSLWYGACENHVRVPQTLYYSKPI